MFPENIVHIQHYGSIKEQVYRSPWSPIECNTWQLILFYGFVREAGTHPISDDRPSPSNIPIDKDN